MTRTLRLLTLSLAATATATAAALGSTALQSGTATASPPAAGPTSFGSHETAVPSPVPVVTPPTARPRTSAPMPVKATPKATPKAAPKATPKASPAPRRTHRAALVAVATPRVSHPPLTAQKRLAAAVDRLPNFHTGDALFALKPGLGSWGLSEMGSGMIYISPTVPADRMYDVVAHEWSHVLSVKPYGDALTAVAAMNAWFGGTGMVGAERAADCMARLMGATWTHYTSCNDTHWRDGARRLLTRTVL